MSSILIDVVRTDSSAADAQLLLGIRGEKGEKGNTGDSGVHVGTTEPTDPVKNVWIDPSDGDNSVLKLKNGSEWEQIDSIKGDKGDTGDSAGFGEVTATVDANHGTPSVTVTASGEDTAKNFAFAFSNLQPAPYDDSVIQARMDSFTNLEEGSTTGDAELIDGRVGADGVTYTNIGGAIRGQVSDLKSALNAIPIQPDFVFTIGEVIASNGAISVVNFGSHTQQIPVSGGDVIHRLTPAKDANNLTLIIHLCQYKDGVFQSRTSITANHDNNPIVLNADTTSISLNFSRASTSGVTMTQADIDTYFSVFLYRKAALEVEQHKSLTSYSISQAQASGTYSTLLANVPSNTFVWTNKTWWSDAPKDNTNFLYLMSLASNTKRGTMSGQGTQLAFFPESGSLFMRRIKSGSWSDWTRSYCGSLPTYRAFGDSLTWGAVWDSNPETALYQADLNQLIPTRIANAIGSTYFYNQGASGARFVKQSPSDSSTIIGDVVKATDFTDVQLVTLGGGRNDSATALGDGATATANDGTICGAVVDILNYLTTNYPKLQIVMYGVTPQPDGVHIAPEYIFTRVFAGGWSLSTYYEEMAKVCKRFNVPFIDWYGCPLIAQWGQLSGGYSSGTRNWSHPLSGDIYTQMGNYLAGKVSANYCG